MIHPAFRALVAHFAVPWEELVAAVDEAEHPNAYFHPASPLTRPLDWRALIADPRLLAALEHGLAREQEHVRALASRASASPTDGRILPPIPTEGEQGRLLSLRHRSERPEQALAHLCRDGGRLSLADVRLRVEPLERTPALDPARLARAPRATACCAGGRCGSASARSIAAQRTRPSGSEGVGYNCTRKIFRNRMVFGRAI